MSIKIVLRCHAPTRPANSHKFTSRSIICLISKLKYVLEKDFSLVNFSHAHAKVDPIYSTLA